jgi:hypothetical protein
MKALAPSEKGILEDLIAAAFNDARGKADAAAAEKCRKCRWQRVSRRASSCRSDFCVPHGWRVPNAEKPPDALRREAFCTQRLAISRGCRADPAPSRAQSSAMS